MAGPFEHHDLADDLAAVREEYAPGAVVLETPDFETLPPAQAEELGLLVDALEPYSFDEAWLPEEPPAGPGVPDALREYASGTFTVGMPGDGGVSWTGQTDPPVVFVTARMEGTPVDFRDFLVAEAFVQAGESLPEHFIGFFEAQYREFAAVVADESGLGPADTYQLAFACFDAYRGLHTRPVFESWTDRDEYARLYDAWDDAGSRLEPRLAGLSREVATGRTGFAAAAELACSAVKHGVDPPTPFGALDTTAYIDVGPAYAVAWARKTLDALETI